MASMAATARDIPVAFDRDSFAAVAARSVPATKNHSLPTPPNSISPNLPPHGLKSNGTRSSKSHAGLANVDSDLDIDHDSSGPDGFALDEHETGAFETAGAITPNLLAKHHLPEILLNHGPLPIRHIMGYLHTSVPGFSGIPPTKARRLVVGALEGRGGNGAMGGLNGDVKFEKVGWGRWDAKAKSKAAPDSRLSPPVDPSSYSIGMPIAKSNLSFDRTRLDAPDSSWAGDSAAFSHDDDMEAMMFEDEADKMSLDGDASCSSSSAAPEEDDVMEDDPDDITDDEDWAAIGAAALRATSYSNSGPRRNFLTSQINNMGSQGGPSLAALAKSVPMRSANPPPSNLDLSAFNISSNSQERDAVEALLRLGSV